MGILPDWMIERDVKITPFRKGPSPGTISSGLGSYGYDLTCGFRFKVFSNVHCGEVDPKNFDSRSLVNVDLTPVRCQWREVKRAMRDETKDYQCPMCETFCNETQMTDEVRQMICNGAEQPEKYLRIPPNSFALAESVEWVEIPRDCIAFVFDKSTYRRVGIVMGATVLEPEWRGIVTLEITNSAPLPARIYPGEGIAQMVLIRTDGHNEAVLQAVMRLCANNTNNILIKTEQDVKKYVNEMLHRELPRGTCRVSYADKKGRYQDQKELTLPFVAEGETTKTWTCPCCGTARKENPEGGFAPRGWCDDCKQWVCNYCYPTSQSGGIHCFKCKPEGRIPNAGSL